MRIEVADYVGHRKTALERALTGRRHESSRRTKLNDAMGITASCLTYCHRALNILGSQEHAG